MLLPRQGDAFAVLAQARDHIAILGFRLVLVLGGLHEAAADQHHRAARQHRVEQRREHEKARNVQLVATARHIEGTADGPEHDDEHGCRQNGLGYTADEIDRRFGGDTHIVGDAVLGIGVVAANQIELEIAPLRQPAVDDPVGEPRPPAPLQGHAGVDLRHTDQNAHGQMTKYSADSFPTAAALWFCNPSKIARFHAFIAYEAASPQTMTSSRPAVSSQAELLPPAAQKPAAVRQNRRSR